MNFKFSLICGLILVLIFTSCSKKSETQTHSAQELEESSHSLHDADEHEGGPGGDYEALPVGFGSPYSAIMDGHLDEWAGTWVNGRGERIQLRANGTFDAGQRTGGFTRGLGTLTTNGTNYEWIVFMEGEDEGFEVLFFPVGVGVKNSAGDVVETHISNDRIFMVFVGSSYDVYYREGELPTQAAANIPSNIAEIIHKRVEAVENGDIAAFRATLSHPEDGGDYNYQLSILNTFFGGLFGITPAAFEEAFSNGTEDLSTYADKLFRADHPPVSKNTGLRIIKIEKDDYSYNVTVTNNLNEKNIYRFPFSSF